VKLVKSEEQGGEVLQEKEIEYRDKVAPEYEQWNIERAAYCGDWLEKRVIMNRINPQPEETILDAGCGTGRLTRLLAPKCKKVYATDFSPRSIEVLNERIRRERIHNVESFVWDITQPFPFNKPVDKVLSCQVVQHILLWALAFFHGRKMIISNINEKAGVKRSEPIK